MVVAKPKDRILPIEIKPSDVAVGSVSDWIQIQLGQWIRKRIRNPDPDPGSVADPGCLSRIPDPDFYSSRIPDPKQQQKRGEKN